MLPYLNISIALIIFMGMASGGIMTLRLMAERRQQISFAIMLAMASLLALIGVIGATLLIDNTVAGLTNALVLLVLSFALGYTLTTFSVLSAGKKKRVVNSPAMRSGRTAVICLSSGEPPEYNVRSAARRFELTDNPQEAPIHLLKPFYMRDLIVKYAAIGRSPYRQFQFELADKVQSRLDSAHVVYTAFYSDHPTYADQVVRAIEDGATKIVVVHIRVTEPPDGVRLGDILEGVNPESYGVRMEQVGPLDDSVLLPQIYVRRVLEALPQMDGNTDQIGLLLIGRGNAAAGKPAMVRREQEVRFQTRVRQALVNAGFDEGSIAMGWLRHRPYAAEALHELIEAGCKTVYWIPSSYPADGVNTLYDMPTQIEPLAKGRGVKLIPLGAWNADDLAAEDIASRVRTPARVPAGRTL